MSEEMKCPNCGHDIGSVCHTKLDSSERACHCTYQARDVAERLIGDLRAERDQLQQQLDVANETINEIVAYAQFDPDNDEYPVVLARKAKSEIAKLGEKK